MLSVLGRLCYRLVAIPATCVCVIANKEAFSVYIAVTAIETVSGNSNINVWHVAW